jgi:transposase
MLKIIENADSPIRKKISLVMAIANGIMKNLNFKEKINEQVKWDKEHWGISPGGIAKAFILSTLTDIRVPLTHIKERLEGVDLEYLIGEDMEKYEINSFNTGRMLDRVGEANYNNIFDSLAMEVFQQYEIPANRMHGDTTTISFSGEYDVENLELTEEEKEELLKIEKGYNKDGRAGDNQVVIGRIVNEYGIPVANRIMDGSTSDVEWNKEALNILDQLRQIGFNHGIFIADSKLVTNELVTRMNSEENHVSFVSRCPANFEEKLEARMTERAYSVDKWENIGKIVNKNGACAYRGASFIETICGAPMRLLVLESTSLVETAECSLKKKEKKLEQLIKELEKKVFACSEDAEKEYARFQQQSTPKFFETKMKIIEES